MDKQVYNGNLLVDQWGNSHNFSVSRAVNISSVPAQGINLTTAFPEPTIPIPYFYIMPTAQTGILKVRLLNSQPNEYVTLNTDTLMVNLGVFMPMKIVEVHKDTTLPNFIIGV